VASVYGRKIDVLLKFLKFFFNTISMFHAIIGDRKKKTGLMRPVKKQVYL
jgi:hypothetical protein